jgi:pimeloyl-ACP methyl ester carboxylesterase
LSTISLRDIPASGQSSTALVFLHEGLGSLESWRDVPDVLAAATGLRTIVASRRGYGASPPYPGPWPATFLEEEATAELPRLLRDLSIDEAILVGHSDGGSIALLLAAAAGGADRAGATVSQTTGRASEQAVMSRPVVRKTLPPAPAIKALVLAAPHVFVEECCVEAIRGLTVGYDDSSLRRSLHRLHGGQADATFAAWSGVWLSPEFRGWNCSAVLPEISCPVIVFQGDRDPYGTALQTDALAHGVAGPVDVVALAGCGHHPHRERREVFVERTTEFLRRAMSH